MKDAGRRAREGWRIALVGGVLITTLGLLTVAGVTVLAAILVTAVPVATWWATVASRRTAAGRWPGPWWMLAPLWPLLISPALGRSGPAVSAAIAALPWWYLVARGQGTARSPRSEVPASGLTVVASAGLVHAASGGTWWARAPLSACVAMAVAGALLALSWRWRSLRMVEWVALATLPAGVATVLDPWPWMAVASAMTAILATAHLLVTDRAWLSYLASAAAGAFS